MTIIEIDYNFMEQRRSRYCLENHRAYKKFEKKSFELIKKLMNSSVADEAEEFLIKQKLQ